MFEFFIIYAISVVAIWCLAVCIKDLNLDPIFIKYHSKFKWTDPSYQFNPETKGGLLAIYIIIFCPIINTGISLCIGGYYIAVLIKNYLNSPSKKYLKRCKKEQLEDLVKKEN